MLNHINVALFVLQLPLLSGLVLGCYDFDLLYVLFAWAFESTLQEIPKDEINDSVKDKNGSKQSLREEPEKAFIGLPGQILVNFVSPRGLNDRSWSKPNAAYDCVYQHYHNRGNDHFPLEDSQVEALDYQSKVAIKEHENTPEDDC